MDRYEDISDGEVDHSFFDSDFEEEMRKEKITTEIDKTENSEIVHNVVDNCDLQEETPKMGDDGITEERQLKEAESQKEQKLDNSAHNADKSVSLLASLTLEDPGDRTIALNKKTLEENIPNRVSQIAKECEENYYTDEEDSSDDTRNQRFRHKFSKQSNGVKVHRNIAISSSSSPSSSSDTDCSGTGSDGCLSASSYYSERKSMNSLSLLSSEQQSSQEVKSMEVKSKLDDHTEESEDTVTDVTPLSTPDISPIQSFELVASSDKKLKVKRQQNVSHDLSETEVDHRCLQKVLREALDLNHLLKACI